MSFLVSASASVYGRRGPDTDKKPIDEGANAVKFPASHRVGNFARRHRVVSGIQPWARGDRTGTSGMAGRCERAGPRTVPCRIALGYGSGASGVLLAGL